jgi:ABC-type phosphate/phosphonate transport system substrate-binding protein
MKRVLLCAVLFGWISVSGVAQERVTFIGVALDQETRLADRKLQDYLYRKTDLDFAPEELEYETVIDRLANWKTDEGNYVARVTPYVYVAAEMLGARFEIIGTYISAATGARIYHSYFVVNRSRFPAPPALPDVLRFLNDHSPARFVYHSRFSTSSYFVPSLYFRSNKVFNMSESTASVTAIRSEKIPENSSSRLVQMVANGEADLAAVWDGTKNKFGETGNQYAEYGSRVYFVQLPTPIPNDLIVCSLSLDPDVKSRLRAAVEKMGPDEIAVGDFRTWNSIRDATEARAALADLRWSARQSIAPVTVDIRMDKHSGSTPAAARLLEAARQAVRLSGTEFVLFDEDFHERIDAIWTLQPTHDGAILLRSSLPGSQIKDQVFQISFQNTEDLTKRIVYLINSGMHRIRYVWPYSGTTAVVIRDMAFSLASGDPARVQQISWLDQERNDYRSGPITQARISEADFYKYRVDSELFGGKHSETAFDPLSNVSYRVYLLRGSGESPVFRALTATLLLLLLLAAVAAVFEARRAAAR